jgi:hypothetical protein
MNKHMKMMHLGEAEHHTAMAKLYKARDDEEMTKLHTEHAEHHIKCAKACDAIETNERSGDELKALSDEAFRKRFGIEPSAVMPTRTSAIAPSDEALRRTAGANKLIPRVGQDLPTQEAETEALAKALPGWLD